jgi:hypothetical protein
MFPSFLLAGFECATQRMPSGQRVDLLALTGHDRTVEADYRRMREYGMLTCREGLRWHLIERRPGVYDFTSVLPMVRAAREYNIQVIWDICHYGWPDDLDIFAPAFVEHLAGLTQAFVRLLREETDQPAMIVPINEISFLSWVAGEVGHFYPFAQGQGYRLKQQLVRASLASIDAIWALLPAARIVFTEPLINVVADPQTPDDVIIAMAQHEAQFQTLDMICGRLDPELGGHPRYLDLIGLNYYPHNQWLHNSSEPAPLTLGIDHPHYRPLHQLLDDVYQRYQRAFFIAETSSLNALQLNWWQYIHSEVSKTLAHGLPLQGICVYPAIDTPDWNDYTNWHHGLWSQPDPTGHRNIRPELAAELRRMQALVGQF